MDCPWHENGTLRRPPVTPEQFHNEEPPQPFDYFLPTQHELDTASRSLLDGPVAFMACLDTEAILKATTVAPHKLRSALKNGDSFEVIWDSGASHTITNDLKDFVGKIKSPGLIKKFTGMASGLNLQGMGEIKWTFISTDGSF